MQLGSEKPQSWEQCLLQQFPLQESQTLPAPCPLLHHTADITRALISPPSPCPVVPGDPQQDVTPPFQAAIDRQAPHCHQQELLFKRLCRRRWAGHRSINHLSCPHSIPFPAELQPGCSLPKIAFPSACHTPMPSAPCPMALLPAGATLLPQFPHQQSTELGDPVGSITSAAGLGTALPGAGHTWMAKPALGITGCLCLTSCLTRTSLCPSRSDPSTAARGPTGAPAPAQPPVGFPSLSRSKAEEMTSLLLPRKTRRLPNTQGLASPRLGHRSPSPLCSSPRQPVRGAEQGTKSRGFWGVSANPPRLSEHCQLKGGESTFVPCLGLGACPGLLMPAGCWAVSGARFPPLGTHRVPGTGSSSLGWLCRRVPCSCWLSPRQKVGQSQLQALTIINRAQASICHWGGEGKDQISQTSGGGSVGDRGQSGRSWRGQRGSVLSAVS